MKNKVKTAGPLFVEEKKQLQNFYDKIFEELNSLINQHEFAKVLTRIEEELNCSYVPAAIERRLRDLSVEVRIRQYEHTSHEIAQYPLVKLLNFVLEDPTKRYDAYTFLVDKYHAVLSPLQWEYIFDIFNSVVFSNEVKFMFLIPLLELNELQNYKFTFYNKDTEKKMELILSKEIFLPYDKFTRAANSHLNEQFYKEPSKLSLAEHLLDLLTTHFFPEFIPFERDKLGKQIVDYVNGSFSGQSLAELLDLEFLSVMNSLLAKTNSNFDD